MKNIATMVAAVVSVAAASFATPIVDTFESTMDSWTGDGKLETATTTSPTGYGYPTTATHTQVLAVSGTVTRNTTGVVSNANVFDMMVKVARPDKTPDDYNSSNPQFAIYSDTDGALKLYCKETSSGSATSVTLGNFAEDEWLRLTIAVDYSNSSLVVATNGVLTASTYYLANAPQSQAVARVNVSGTTAIDDFVAKNGSFEPYAQVTAEGAAAVAEGSTVPNAYLTKSGKSSESETIVNSSPSMTVAQAYLVGVAPVAGATFAIEKASFNGSSLTLTFPGDWPAGSYTIKYGTTASCTETATITTATKTGSGNQVTIPLNFGESGNVLYYKVTR